MHIPLSRYEISGFLAIDESCVEELWHSGSLKRSLSNDLRSNSALAQSSMFDVLEVALWSGLLGVKLCRHEAENWTELLCHMCDWNDWHYWSPQKKIDCLLEYAVNNEEISVPSCSEAASVLTAAHSRLIVLCLLNDQDDSL